MRFHLVDILVESLRQVDLLIFVLQVFIWVIYFSGCENCN